MPKNKLNRLCRKLAKSIAEIVEYKNTPQELLHIICSFQCDLQAHVPLNASRKIAAKEANIAISTSLLSRFTEPSKSKKKKG